MENANEPEAIKPTPTLPTAKKWYRHKGFIIIFVLSMVAAVLIWVYLTLNQRQDYVPIMGIHKQKTLTQNKPTITPSTKITSSLDSFEVLSIRDPYGTGPLATISPDSEIEIYWTGLSTSTISTDGDQFGDGFWLSNGVNSIFLENQKSREIYQPEETQSMTVVYIPSALCPGAETLDCSVGEPVPFTAGVYSLNLKQDQGGQKSRNYDIFAAAQPPDIGYKNFLYFILDDKSQCSDRGYDTVDYCNGSIGQLNNSINQYTVLIPDLWKLIPELETTPGLTQLLFAEQNTIFLKTYGYGGGEGFVFDINFYRYNIQLQKLMKLDYSEGYCAAPSPDNVYMADSINNPDNSTELRVFNLDQNKTVYTLNFPTTQSLGDGTNGMGCNSSVSWDKDKGDTLTYTVYDASKQSDGETPYLTIEEKS